MGRLSWIFCAVLIGCGGSTPEAEGPESEPNLSEASASDDTDDGEPSDEHEAAEPSDEATSDESSSMPASSEDVQKVLQMVLDDDELEPWLKLGEPGRFPLKVAGDSVLGDLELTKNTKPVAVVDGPENDGDAVLVFTEIDVQSDRAYVKFRYDVEDIRGSTSLEKGKLGWEIKNSRVVERKPIERQ